MNNHGEYYKYYLDEVMIQNNNVPMSIPEILIAIKNSFGIDFDYKQIYYVLHYEKYCDDYVKIDDGTNKYQLEPLLFSQKTETLNHDQ